MCPGRESRRTRLPDDDARGRTTRLAPAALRNASRKSVPSLIARYSASAEREATDAVAADGGRMSRGRIVDAGARPRSENVRPSLTSQVPAEVTRRVLSGGLRYRARRNIFRKISQFLAQVIDDRIRSDSPD